ncbi:hypothetical protein [Myxosarcina sp. GI1(2024)]
MTLFQLNGYLIGILEPVGVSLRFFCASSLIGLCAWSLVSAVADAVTRAKRMHQIPCTTCRFFTCDYRLKCTVRPHAANTELAIDCSDYQSK